MNTTKATIVLLVEDDPGDQKLVKNALADQDQDVTNEFHVANSGEEALEYLQRSKIGDEQSPWPNLILLDLNMPGMGGREFLKRMKADDDLCAIPVIVLTVSDSEVDIQECYRLNVAGYVQKLASPEEFQTVVKKLAKYWSANSAVVKS
jgi:CheY-like chemotaxis protein